MNSLREIGVTWPGVGLAALLGLMLAVGCGQQDGAPAAGSAPPEPPPEIEASDFGAARFDSSTFVDNTWFPLRPGTQFVYTGSSLDDDKRRPHRVVFTVSDVTKVVAGVEAVVGWDRDYTDGELVEAELVFFAQDMAGNVWHLGQYPEEYENGRFVAAQAWIAGVEGARAGVFIRAHSMQGSSDYAQGFAPAPVSWHDRARVFRADRRTCVPVGCYEGVLVMEEFELDKPDAFQLKYYAPGVGNVRVGWRGANEDSREVLVLERIAHLDAGQLAKARKAVMALERSAYRRSPDVYGTTAPAH
jgi:hypothetical protein